MSPSLYVGLDLGASRIKVVVLNQDGQLAGYAVKKSGTDFAGTARLCLDASLRMAEAGRDDIAGAVSTGYGRASVGFITDKSKSEIGALGRGCRHFFSGEITIIDIGGQDNKIVKLNDRGGRSSFKMNRKCAAGTGSFLEEMSYRLDISLEEMNDLASRSENIIKLGSYCTVFSATEVLENIRNGKKVDDIVKGIFYSVIKRVLEMGSLAGRVVMTGGVVAHNPYIVTMAEEMIGRQILLPEYPQLACAIGAALYAMDGEADKV